MGSALDTSLDHTTPKTEPREVINVAPIVSSYNEHIRPVLDAVENLRRLNITKEGIQLPTIVVVGDQSSGKSSVLESLAGISLPRGQGICTRVPLVMRLQNHSLPKPELKLEFNGKNVCTDEAHVSEAISVATNEVAGCGKGISNTPLTLVVKKKGVPDLTMVDLPGITRVAIHGQPKDIYDQIVDIIMEYIRPEESIILNVLSATVDFSTCESIRMSQSVDKTGQRTLAVVTKVDKAPEGLHEKVTADDVSIGLGYVCVRNRTGDESYEEARAEEAKLFQIHPLLSKIDKSIAGVPALAQKLVQLQAASMSKILPEIVKKINDKLASQFSELEKLPEHLASVADAMSAFMHIIGLAKETFRKILLRGEFDEYPDVKHMHCTARLVDMLDQYSNDLQKGPESVAGENFLMEEVKVLEEAKCIGLPNFMPRTAFLSLLHNKVNAISSMPIEFIDKVWDYLERVVVAVLMGHSEHYPQLQTCTRRVGHSLIAEMNVNSIKYLKEVVEMEHLTDYTCNPEYIYEYDKLMARQNYFVERVNSGYASVDLEGFGNVKVSHLKQYPSLLVQAFDVKMRLTAYWKIVSRRLIDNTALHLQFSISKLVNKYMGNEFVKDIMIQFGGGIEKLLEETPSLAMKRDKLRTSIEVLRESKNTLENYAYEMRERARRIEEAAEETIEWLERNQLADVEEFEYKKQELARYLRDDPNYNYNTSNCDEVKVPIWCTWRYPPNGWVCLNTDGSVFENHRNGRSGGACGGLVRDSTGCFLGGFSANIGPTSVILSELWGVVHGLKLAWDLGCKKVKVDIDSGNALGVVRHCPMANDPAFALVSEINELVRKDWLVEFSHVLRESNRAADKLAHLGHSHSLDKGAIRFSDPPSAIVDILRDDLAGIAKQRGVR